tara:strand:+ start:1273 stop:1470 length:198 start_codon:yes stop_codon:yes gene_type:complete
MRLHEQVKKQAEIIALYEEQQAALVTYLNSAKFSADVMVNKNDIFLRLGEYHGDIEWLKRDLETN